MCWHPCKASNISHMQERTQVGDKWSRALHSSFASVTHLGKPHATTPNTCLALHLPGATAFNVAWKTSSLLLLSAGSRHLVRSISPSSIGTPIFAAQACCHVLTKLSDKQHTTHNVSKHRCTALAVPNGRTATHHGAQLGNLSLEGL